MRKAVIRMGVLGAVSSLALLTGAARAQDSASGAVDDSPQQNNDVIVTGTRSSLENAEQYKRDSDVLVDGISADDIGALPDQSIADSLVRIPGLTANDDENGFSEVSVRGLGPDFANTTFNGRILPSTRLENRRLDLGDLPTEGIARAYVQKTASAATIEGGLGGTIGLESVKPLETRRSGFSIVARGTTDDVAQALKGVYGFKPWGYRGELTYVGRLTDTLGFAVSYARIKQTNAAPSTQLVNPRTRTLTPDGDGDGLFDVVPGNAGINMGAGTQKRDSLLATVQWKPTPSLTATLDGYYISIAGQSTPINFIAMNNNTVTRQPTVYEVEDSLVRRYQGFTSLYQETVNISRQKSRQLQGGLNLKFDNGSPFIAAFDVSYAQAKVSGQNRSATIRTLPNDARRTAAGQVRPSGYDTTDPHDIVFDFGTQAASDYMLVDLNVNNPNLTDTAYASRLDFRYDRPLGFIRTMDFGLRADRRVKDNTPDGNTYTFGGLTTNPALNDTFLVAKPSPLGDAAQWLGGPSAATIPLFDLDKLFAFTTDPRAVFNPQAVNDARGDSRVTEDTMALYYQANIDTGRLTGNIGLRYFLTDIAVDGVNVTATQTPTPQTVKNSYHFLLPSMNLRYEVARRLYLRGALSKTISRPVFTAVRIGSAVDFTNLQPGDTVARGNPNLKPYSSKNVDIDLEWYPNRWMMLGAQGFYKQVSNFITNELVEGTIATPAGNAIPVLFNTSVNDPEKRHFYGLELIARRDFNFLPGVLSNLGLRLDYSRNWTDAIQDYQTVDGRRINLTPNNFTKVTANAQLYYSTRRFDARVAYRYYSPYLRENSNGYQSRPAGALDLTSSIVLARGIRAIGTVRNATKARIYSTQVDDRYPVDGGSIPRNVIYPGRQITVGVRAAF